MRIFTTTQMSALVITAAAAVGLGAAATAGTTAGASAPASGSTTAAVNCAKVPRPSTYKAYANALMSAWAQGNTPLGRCYAYDYVADFLFAQNAKGNGWTYSGVRVLDGTARVTYRKASGATLQLSILDPAGTRSPAVYATAMNGAATGRVTTYADKLVRAWGAGDKKAALQFGTPQVVNALWSFSDGPGGGCWARETTLTGLEPQGSSVTYRCESASVTLTVRNWAAAEGTPQSVVRVRTNPAG